MNHLLKRLLFRAAALPCATAGPWFDTRAGKCRGL